MAGQAVLRAMNQMNALGSKRFFHIYNRGKDDKEIFIDHSDYFRFTLMLYCCNNTEPTQMKKAQCVGANYYGLAEVKRGKPLVDIISHSLMPNRFHLLIRERGVGSVSKFMAKLSTGYTMHFNQKYQRRGPLFAGPFQFFTIRSEAELKYLFAYIHLKPLKHGVNRRKHPRFLGDDLIKASLRRYEYSSYLDYMGKDRLRKIILEPTIFEKYFKSPADFERNIFDWLRLDKTRDLVDRPNFFNQNFNFNS